MNSRPHAVPLNEPARRQSIVASMQAWLHRLTGRPTVSAPDHVAPELPPDLLPGAPFLAACRQLRVRLVPDAAQDVLPPLLLVGGDSGPDYGLAAAGLALALAETGRATLLVDADLRAPTVATLFGKSSSPGFADLLRDPTATPAIVPVTDSLALLPAGEARSDADDLLSRATLSATVQQLASRQEAIIFYTAGHWEQADVLLLAPPIGRAAFLIRTGSQATMPMRRVRIALDDIGVTMLGFALLD